MRKKYSVGPDCCCDCCVMWCCGACAVAQMYYHVYEEKSDCSICSDPGPHPEMQTTTDKTVEVAMVAQPPAVVAATAEPVVVAAQPVVVAAPPPVVAVATAQPL